MNGYRSRYPCAKCVHQVDCEPLLRDLRNALLEARLRGMPRELPEVFIDCHGRYSPPSRVLPKLD